MFRTSPVENPVLSLALVVVLLTSVPPSGGQGIGSVTLLDGSLQVIRGTTVFRGAEGTNIQQGDILESSTGAFVQLEFTNGPIIALGPSSRLYVLQETATQANGTQMVALDLVMLNGWFKGESAPGKRLYRYRSPLLAITTNGGNVVVRSSLNTCDIFVESGSASIGEVSQNGISRQNTRTKAGQFSSRQKGAEVTNLPFPTSVFLESMPRQFRDTLPARIARFEGKSVALKTDHPVSFDEIEPWLTIPSTWRSGLAERFAPRLSDAEFRKQVERHLNELPDWDAILHPKKSSESPQVRN